MVLKYNLHCECTEGNSVIQICFYGFFDIFISLRLFSLPFLDFKHFLNIFLFLGFIALF